MFQLSPIGFHINPWVLAIIIIVVVVSLVMVVIWSVRAHQRQIGAGREEMIGRIAVAESALDPKGTVFIDGEHWTAISEEGKIKAREEVIVTRVQGLKLYVAKNSPS
ncbi:MAG: NfeD family protein [Chloroflexota bacterium]